MRRGLLALVTVLLLATLVTSLAHAGGWSFEWHIGSLVADGTIWGLRTNVNVSLTGYGSTYALCQNYGGNVAPGRNPIHFDVVQAGYFTTDQNGKALVWVAAPDPTLATVIPSPTPKEAGCPNENWTVIGYETQKVDWTDAHMVVNYIDTGELVYDLWFTCDTIFDANGIAVEVNCAYVP